MSLFRTLKMLHVRFPHFLLIAFGKSNINSPKCICNFTLTLNTLYYHTTAPIVSY